MFRPDFEAWISSNIHIAEDLLADMIATAQNPSQINLHVEHLKNMSGLTYLVENDLMELSVLERDHANDAELKDFGNSIIDIGRRASTFYKDLCAREASISNANTDLLHARKAAHEGMEYRRQAALHLGQAQDAPQLQSGRKYHQQAVLSYLPDPSQHQGQVQPQLHEVQDPDNQEQVRDLTSSRPTPMPPEEYHDTAGIQHGSLPLLAKNHEILNGINAPVADHDGDSTRVTTEKSDNMEHATAAEALQTAQQKVQDGPRHQYTSRALELPETPRLPTPDSHIDVLKDGIRSSILDAEDLLAKMMTTTQTGIHVWHLNRMSYLTYKVDDDLDDIRSAGEDHTTAEELNGFGNSIFNIGRIASKFYNGFAREVSILKAKADLLHAILLIAIFLNL